MKNKPNFFQRNALFIIVYVFLLAFSAFLIVMLAWGLLTSLKSSYDFSNANNVLGWPNLNPNDPYNSCEQFYKLSNYSLVFSKFKIKRSVSFYQFGTEVIHKTGLFNNGYSSMGEMIFNSVLYAGGGALIYAFMPALTAYLCSKYNYKLSKILFVVYTVIMCLPIVGNFPAEVTFLRNTGLYDQIWGNYIQKMGGGGMYFFVYYAFFKGLSNTYREAAEIDGASELRIMCRIYFPLASKIIATVFLIQFVALWNDFSTPLLYLPTHPTLSYGVYKLAFNTSGDTLLQSVPVKMAACMMLAVPIMIIFIIFKNKLMGNISLGGIKE